ncbi:MAG: hypothetical protein A2521_09520 [Deltaproteobacteria bacterium RIFOXYD12_FULL_57_12]|nr:MAG: hypothetical protein A2521_09520 [Deltaproteobacteria bacterium RIFOXYD12_FULL_57_12]
MASQGSLPHELLVHIDPISPGQSITINIFANKIGATTDKISKVVRELGLNSDPSVSFDFITMRRIRCALAGTSPDFIDTENICTDLITMSENGVELGNLHQKAEEFLEAIASLHRSKKRKALGAIVSDLLDARTPLAVTDDKAVNITRIIVKFINKLEELENFNLSRKFRNLCDKYDAVRLQRGLWEELINGSEGVRKLVYDAWNVGSKLFQTNEDNAISNYYGENCFRMGKICQAFTETAFKEIRLDSINNFEEIMLDGIYYLSTALEQSTDPRDQKHHQPISRCHKALGEYYFAADKLEQAEEEYRKAIEHFNTVLKAPEEACIRETTRFEVLREMAECQKYLGFLVLYNYSNIEDARILWGEAEETFLNAHQIIHEDRTGSVLLFAMADFYIQTRQPDKALSFYPRILALEAKDQCQNSKTLYDLYSYRWGLALMYSGRHEEAKDQFAATLRRNPEEYYQSILKNEIARQDEILANIQRKAQTEYSAVVQPYRTVTEYRLDSILWHDENSVLLGKSRFIEVERRLIELFNKAADFPDSFWSKWLTCDAGLLCQFGLAKQGLGDYVAAKTYLLKALKENPNPRNQAIVFDHLGDLCKAEGDINSALERYNRSWEIGKILPQKHLGPLLKAATVSRQIGQFEESLNFIEMIEKSGLDMKPQITATQKALTLWARYIANADSQDADMAVSLVGAVINNYGDPRAINALEGMLPYEKAILTAGRLLLESQDYKVVRGIKHALERRHCYPTAILQFVMGRLWPEPSEITSIDRTPVREHLIRIISCFLVHAYYHGEEAGDQSFNELAPYVINRIMNQGPEQTQWDMAKLFTGERAAPAREAVNQYAEEVHKVFECILARNEEPRNPLSISESFKKQINDLLNRKTPRPPAEEGSNDQVPLSEKLAEFIANKRHESLRPEDAMYRDSIQFNFEDPEDMHSNREQFIPRRKWMEVERSLEIMLDTSEPTDPNKLNPLMGLFSATGNSKRKVIWNQEMVSIFLKDTNKSLEEVQTALEATCKRFPAKYDVEPIVTNGDCLLNFHLPKGKQANIWGQFPHEDFVAYLRDNTEKYLSGEKDADFYSKAENKFPVITDVANILVADWVESYRAMLDVLHGVMESRLAACGRDAVHNLRALVKKSGELSNIAELRRWVIRLETDIRKTISSDLEMIWLDETDLSKLLFDIVARLYTGDAIDIDCPPGTYVRCKHWMMERALINLLDNALKATKDLEENTKQITIRRLPDTGRSCIAIEITNHFDPGKDISGSGIGTRDAETFMNAQQGWLKVLPDPESKMFTVELRLQNALIDHNTFDQVPGGIP